MKAKHIIPIIAGGILGTGAAVFAYSEIKRLKGMISAGEEYMKGQGDCIRSLDEVIKKKDEEIAALNDVITGKDELIALQEEMIALHEEEVSILKNNQGPAEEATPDGDPAVPPEDPPDEPEQPKREKKTRKEYVFQYDSDFNVVGKYESFADAARSLGLKSQTSIGKVANGKEASAGGYFWSKGVSPLKKFPVKWEITAKTMKNKKRVN